jgi:FkbM family methyltransferase
MTTRAMEDDLIYDVGFNRGQDTDFYLKKGFRVLAIEALPRLCDLGRERFRSCIESGQLTILNVAIASTPGPITFFECEKDEWGTISADMARRNTRLGAKSSQITVQGASFADILREYGVPYFLKVDIEGADLLCLSALEEFQARPRHISIEAEVDFLSALRNELGVFQSLGYSKFKVVRQGHVPLQACPFPQAEGAYVDYRFEYGSSGLFGEEAPGAWMSATETLKQYSRIVRVQRLFGAKGIVRRFPFGDKVINRLQPDVSWYDTHATT